MFCSNCGCPISDSRGICPNCGEQIPFSHDAVTETTLYKKWRVSYHPSRWSRITGVFTLTTKRIIFEPHMFMEPLELAYNELNSVPDMGSLGLGPYFTLVLKDGCVLMFSLNSPSKALTQSVIDTIRAQKGKSMGR